MAGEGVQGGAGQAVEGLISRCSDFGFYLESDGKCLLQYSRSLTVLSRQWPVILLKQK